MRLIAYICPGDDAEALRDKLRALSGVAAVACRSGRLWTSGHETGFDRVWAPEYPAILAAYAAAGVPAIDAPAPATPWHPQEVTRLEPVADATILCHGDHAARELAAHPPIGLLIAVNISAKRLMPDVLPDVVVANDGLIRGNRGLQARLIAVRAAMRSTLAAGQAWFDLGRLGIDGGRSSVICAIQLAEAMQVRRLRLIGHDCLPGQGWTRSHIEANRADAAVHLRRLAAAGVAVEHIRSDGKREWIDTYQEATR